MKLRKRVGLWLLNKLLGTIQPSDFLDLNAMSDNLYREYVGAAKHVYRNEAFHAEIDRVLYKQEQHLLNKAQHGDDIIVTRAAILVLKELKARFEYLNQQARMLNEESE